MDVILKCPGCASALPVAATEAAAEISCGRCGQTIPLRISEDVRLDRRVDLCPVCEGADFYARKDFNPQLGLAVVIVGALVSACFYWFGKDLVAYSTLAAATLIDLVIYTRLNDVTVCYRCHAEFRGSYARSAPAFDLHTADVLEVEYERKIGRR